MRSGEYDEGDFFELLNLSCLTIYQERQPPSLLTNLPMQLEVGRQAQRLALTAWRT